VRQVEQSRLDGVPSALERVPSRTNGVPSPALAAHPSKANRENGQVTNVRAGKRPGTSIAANSKATDEPEWRLEARRARFGDVQTTMKRKRAKSRSVTKEGCETTGTDSGIENPPRSRQRLEPPKSNQEDRTALVIADDDGMAMQPKQDVVTHGDVTHGLEPTFTIFETTETMSRHCSHAAANELDAQTDASIGDVPSELATKCEMDANSEMPQENKEVVKEEETAGPGNPGNLLSRCFGRVARVLGFRGNSDMET